MTPSECPLISFGTPEGAVGEKEPMVAKMEKEKRRTYDREDGEGKETNL